MGNRSTLSEIFGSLRSAVAVAAALESRREPKARDLRRLGIDPEQFRGMGRL